MSDERSPDSQSVSDRRELMSSDASLPAEHDLPPVVARMVVEIRSDGRRTVARGALEDLASGERVAVRADGTTPLALASALAKSLLKTPVFARQAVRALLQPRRKRG